MWARLAGDEFIIMHCVSASPAPPSDDGANLTREDIASVFLGCCNTLPLALTPTRYAGPHMGHTLTGDETDGS